MFAQRVPQRASGGGRAGAQLAAQDSRLQQNATIRPVKSVAAEQWKETKASVDTSTMQSIANSLLPDVALVALCRGWPETLPLAALGKLPKLIDADEPVTAWLFASKADAALMAKYVVRYPRKLMAELFRGSRDMESRQCTGDFKQSRNVGSLFSLRFKRSRARYSDCPRQIARTIDAHSPGIWHLDFKPAESCPGKQPRHLSARV
jgi:hypothetical protein